MNQELHNHCNKLAPFQTYQDKLFTMAHHPPCHRLGSPEQGSIERSFMNIDILRGAEAHLVLDNDGFRREWLRLTEQCSWSTAFQGPGFACEWYSSYLSRFDPVLVLSRTEDGQINGLLALAASSEGGGLVVAGAEQAEYQAWVCPPDLGDTFAWHAVQSLQRMFPRAVLTFRYLPPGTPTAWLAAAEARQICRLEVHRRPLLLFGDGEEIARSLKKRHNKTRLNRLKRLGNLEFKRIVDLNELEEVFNGIIGWYDFRHAAIHGSTPFRDDQFKKTFHLNMMKCPDLLHVTVLKVGDQLASAHINTCGNKEIHLGILAHNPWLAHHSPGAFHIYFLSQLLMREGYGQLDLTPGSDRYKSDFANSFDEVHTLTVFPSPKQRRKEDIRRLFRKAARKALTTVCASPERVTLFVSKLKEVRPVRVSAGLVWNARRWIGRRREVRVYSYEAVKVQGIDVPTTIRRDVVEDLLGYEPAYTWQSRQRFLSTSLARLKDGHHVYTYAEEGRLLHYGWFTEGPDQSLLSESCQPFAFPPNSAYLFDFYTFPQARGRGLYTHCLQKMLSDLSHVPGTDKIYIAVMADNRPARHVIDKMGFTHELSLYDTVRSGGSANGWTGVIEPVKREAK